MKLVFSVTRGVASENVREIEVSVYETSGRAILFRRIPSNGDSTCGAACRVNCRSLSWDALRREGVVLQIVF